MTSLENKELEFSLKKTEEKINELKENLTKKLSEKIFISMKEAGKKISELFSDIHKLTKINSKVRSTLFSLLYDKIGDYPENRTMLKEINDLYEEKVKIKKELEKDENKTVHLNDKDFVISKNSEEIEEAVTNIAERMNEDLQGKEVVFLGVLNGAVNFTEDIMNKITLDHDYFTKNYIKLASYNGTQREDTVKRVIGLDEEIKKNIEGKTVVIIEDIVDSGNTMNELLKDLNELKPSEIKIAALLFKPGSFQHQ
jgi:hypoxanthine phosphoribosyltransferase